MATYSTTKVIESRPGNVFATHDIVCTRRSPANARYIKTVPRKTDSLQELRSGYSCGEILDSMLLKKGASHIPLPL